MAGSDWILRPDGDTYSADEAYFLECILGFVETVLGEADVRGAEDWITTRREQLAAGALTYVAHQYDLLYQTP